MLQAGSRLLSPRLRSTAAPPGACERSHEGGTVGFGRHNFLLGQTQMLIRRCTLSHWRAGVCFEVGHQFRSKVHGCPGTIGGSCLGPEGILSTSLNPKEPERTEPERTGHRSISSPRSQDHRRRVQCRTQDNGSPCLSRCFGGMTRSTSLMIFPLPASPDLETPTETLAGQGSNSAVVQSLGTAPCETRESIERIRQC